MNYSEWRRRSVHSIWHPYSDMTAMEKTAFPIIERAEGGTLYDIEGRAFLDGISSWWCVNLGHSHPRLIRAIQEQAARLQHTLLGGMSHPRAIELAERLADIAPHGIGHAMFAADGSVAVEAALKMALQYWSHRGETRRTRFIALQDGYHGDTLGAIGAGYVETFHRAFLPALQPARRAMSPYCNRCPFGLHPETCDAACFGSMDAMVREHHAECAAIIVEPLIQCAGGMRIYPPVYLRRLRALCDEFHLPLIADEIATGFGRTGTMFACEQAGIRPDIMTLGKGLTGGMLPMSATLVTDEIYDTFRAVDGHARTFFHGTTFCGNPITSAVALAALEVYREERIVEHAAITAQALAQGMARIARQLDDSPLRTLGMIAAIEIKDSAGGVMRARQTVRRALERGLFLRPLGATLYLWPPLNTDRPTLNHMLAILEEAVAAPAHD